MPKTDHAVSASGCAGLVSRPVITHTHTGARVRARTHTRTHARTQKQNRHLSDMLFVWLYLTGVELPTGTQARQQANTAVWLVSFREVSRRTARLTCMFTWKLRVESKAKRSSVQTIPPLQIVESEPSSTILAESCSAVIGDNA